MKTIISTIAIVAATATASFAQTVDRYDVNDFTTVGTACNYSGSGAISSVFNTFAEEAGFDRSADRNAYINIEVDIDEAMEALSDHGHCGTVVLAGPDRYAPISHAGMSGEELMEAVIESGDVLKFVNKWGATRYLATVTDELVEVRKDSLNGSKITWNGDKIHTAEFAIWELLGRGYKIQ